MLCFVFVLVGAGEAQVLVYIEEDENYHTTAYVNCVVRASGVR